MERACIIAVGTELVLGQTVDTNSAWLAQQLAAIGLRTARHFTAPDELAAIADVLRLAADAGDLVLVTGGLGPTDDDLTRQALAEAMREQMTTDPRSVERIRAYFAERGREMPASNLVQAQRPSSARTIDNTCGTAPGIHAVVDGTPCYVLPGVPYEMRAMFERDILPTLRAATAGRVICSRVLRCVGISEADLGERIRDLMARERNPEIGTSAEMGIIDVRLNALADSHQLVKELLDAAESEVRGRLGKAVFGTGDQTLAGALGRRLIERGQTVSTAESCTGGLVGKLLTDVPGSSSYYVGGAVCYSDDLKRSILDVPEGLLREHGAVSEPVAHALAENARRKFGSTHALSITGIAGPGGGSADKPVGTVYIGMATPQRTDVRVVLLGSDSPRDVIRMRAARAALSRLWRFCQ